ncbi:PAS domain-containing protein [Verrucomicrobiota bacterium sgz303538]
MTPVKESTNKSSSTRAGSAPVQCEERAQNPTLPTSSTGVLANEKQAARIAALRRTGLLDSPPEPEFDRITRLAARLLHAPTAVMTLVDEHRDFFKSAVGLPEPLAGQRQAPHSHSFCKHVVATDGPLVIEDARAHPLVCDNPAVQDLGVIAYLGVPIHAPGGEAIATLCVVDSQPRHWTEEDVESVQDLATSIATEIALRWQLEESHRISERFEHFISASPAALYVFDIVEKCIVFSSGRDESWVGSTLGRVAWRDTSFVLESVHPEDRQGVSNYIERLHHLADGETASFEYRLLQPDGSACWILSRDMVLRRDAAGAVREVIGSAFDITDRKHAEEALRQSEERLDLAMRGAALGMWDWNIRTGEVIYNRRWAEMIGYELEEIRPHFSEWETRVHPEDRAHVLAAIDAHARGLTPFFAVEHRLRAKDGSWKWILTSGKSFDPDAEGRPQRAAGIHLDITDRKNAEAASQAADRKLARILESMDEACCALDANWRFTFINPRCQALFGWREDKVIGRTLWEVLPQIIGTEVGDSYRKAMAERIPFRYEALSSIMHRWLQVRSFPAADGGLSIFILDVHERKLAEEVLRETDRRKDEFIAMLGHELRNPLAAIRHALGLCNTDESPEVFHWAKAVVDRQSTHLARLVDDLLDVSRITQGKVELRKQRLDVAAVLDQTLEEMRPLIAEQHHELTVSYEHDVLWIDGDAARLGQIFSNLLNNAAKYTPPGGHIWLEASREPLSGDIQKQEVVISVCDNGAGIAPGKLPQMFELFVQGERSLARSEGGLGLGLTIVKNITEMHGGYVSAQSEGLGQGSTFTVHLPVASAPAPAPASATVSRTPSSPHRSIPHRVLVVDDMTDTAQCLAKLLRRQGHTVEVAHDGPQACEQAHTFAPEVVLLDIGMPGMDGYEVARHLRHDQACADSFIVALTGYGQEEDRRRALDAGFNEHLVKPVNIERIQQLVEKAPSRREK